MEKKTFDLLSLTTEMEGDKINAVVGGTLGPAVEPFVRQFFSVLNSLKVVAKKDGANFYNLYNPPMPTKAGMRALERKFKEIVFRMVFPATANLAVTHKCQCRCRHCSAGPFVDPNREELSADEIKKVVDDSLELGASIVIFTGGEPTLRKDLSELIDYVDKDMATPMIFTNGGMLTAENVKSYAKAGLATVNISIDSVDPAKHDAYRRVPGLFKSAVAGGKRALDAGILVGLSTYATHDNITDGTLEDLLNFAIKEGFKEVTIFDCIPSGCFLKQTDLILTNENRANIVKLLDRYHESGDCPIGVIAQTKVNSPEGAGCFGAHSQFYMTAYGDINPCDFNPITFGNVREMPLAVIWHKMLSHPDFAKHHKTCRMQTPAYRAKYIDPLPEGIKLPVPIEVIDEMAARSQGVE